MARIFGFGLPQNWRPSPEDESFARWHGMNPKGVAHALRNDEPGGVAAEGGKVDRSARFRDWVVRHAIEAPIIFPLF
jgi:hypothetical protein